MAIAPTPLTRRMTEQEFMNLPNDGRKYELVDGEAKEVPASVRHDIIGITVAVLLRTAARGHGFVAGPQAGFRMTTSNIRCPDVSFTRKERFPGGIPPDTFGDFAPDLCVEIISPSEERSDMTRKLHEYFASGAQQVWRMYPETETLERFTSPVDVQTLTANDVIDGGDLLPNFQCKVADLFALE